MIKRVYSERERIWLWLSDVLGTNVALIDKLLFLNDGPEQLFEDVKKGFPIKAPEKIGKEQWSNLFKTCSESCIDTLIEKLISHNVYAVTRDSSDYPELLREIYDPPAVLYVKGRLPERIDLPIAVVGSRKCSDYGKQMAAYFGKELAAHGACVVSGLAVGCDSEAAYGALKNTDKDCPTIAVLGCGVNVVYPYSSKDLYESIAERGAVISEFKIDRKPTKESFPQRNRIISGISRGVLVIEAGYNSGTRITTDFAHEQGRDVFAVPGRITDLNSVGTNGMIKAGEAKPVFDVDDILYEYGVHYIRSASPVVRFDVTKLDLEQRKVYNVLALGEKNIDELCEATGFSVSELNMYLTEMELSEIIKKLPNGEYAVC